MLGLLIFVIALGGSSYYLLKDTIAASGPDSPWYWRVKLATEWIHIQTASNSAQKIQLKLQFMQERLTELANLEQAKKLTKENVEKIQKNYDALAQDLMLSLKQQVQNVIDVKEKALVQKAQNVIAAQQDSLRKILNEAPNSVREPVGSFVMTIGDAYDRATAIFKGE